MMDLASGDNASLLANSSYGFENAVMMAKHYGELKGAIEGRLMTKTEAEEAGCTENTTAQTCPTWMSGRWTGTGAPVKGYLYWWLGSAGSANRVWNVYGSNGVLDGSDYDNTNRGVRPVIIVSKS